MISRIALRLLTLKIQFKLASHGSSEAIEELPDPEAAGVVLDIARVEMVGDVENYDACARLLIQERYLEAFQDGRIKR